MRPLSRVRFNALAGYCRLPETVLVYEEVGWFEHANERVVGVVARDYTDQDFGGIVYGRDRRGRFRCIYVTPHFESSPRRAKVQLRRAMEQLALAPDEVYYQDDEKKGKPLDFLTPRVPRERLNPIFRDLVEKEKRTAARGIIGPMMKWYEDPDGNFVEQFQTTAFDARLWELYLFATFREMGYSIDRTHAVPDFICRGIHGECAVEAVTVNPSSKPGPVFDKPEAIDVYMDDYLPIRYSSALTYKLAKEYWKKPHIAGIPLLFAIQDFSEPRAMQRARPPLRRYLYGYEQKWVLDEFGRPRAAPERVTTHRWNGKEIPSGFFSLEHAENISAVLFNASGTVSKFNRMGVVAGFGSPRVRMFRKGRAVPSGPNQAELIPFCHDVTASDYSETWVEGLDVYHSPHAKHPIDPEMFPGAAHYFLQPSGELAAMMPPWHPLWSTTYVSNPDEEDEPEAL